MSGDSSAVQASAHGSSALGVAVRNADGSTPAATDAPPILERINLSGEKEAPRRTPADRRADHRAEVTDDKTLQSTNVEIKTRVINVSTSLVNERQILSKIIDQLIKTEEDFVQQLANFVEEKIDLIEIDPLRHRILLKDRSMSLNLVVESITKMDGGWVRIRKYLSDCKCSVEDLEVLNTLVDKLRELHAAPNPFVNLSRNPRGHNPQLPENYSVLAPDFMNKLNSPGSNYFDHTVKTLHSVITHNTAQDYYICVSAILNLILNNNTRDAIWRIFSALNSEQIRTNTLTKDDFVFFGYRYPLQYLFFNLFDPLIRICSYVSFFDELKNILGTNVGDTLTAVEKICSSLPTCSSESRELLGNVDDNFEFHDYNNYKTDPLNIDYKLKRHPDVLSLMAMILRAIDCYKNTELWKQYKLKELPDDLFLLIKSQRQTEVTYANDLANLVILNYMRDDISDSFVKRNLIEAINSTIKELSKYCVQNSQDPNNSVLLNTLFDIISMQCPDVKMSVVPNEKSTGDQLEELARAQKNGTQPKSPPAPVLPRTVYNSQQLSGPDDDVQGKSMANEHYICQHVIVRVKSYLRAFDATADATMVKPDSNLAYAASLEIQKELFSMLLAEPEDLQLSCGKGTIRDLVLAVLANHLMVAGVVNPMYMEYTFKKILYSILRYLNELVVPWQRAKTFSEILIPDPIPTINSNEIVNDKFAMLACILMITDYYLNTPLGKSIAKQTGTRRNKDTRHEEEVNLWSLYAEKMYARQRPNFRIYKNEEIIELYNRLIVLEITEDQQTAFKNRLKNLPAFARVLAEHNNDLRNLTPVDESLRIDQGNELIVFLHDFRNEITIPPEQRLAFNEWFEGWNDTIIIREIIKLLDITVANLRKGFWDQEANDPLANIFAELANHFRQKQIQKQKEPVGVPLNAGNNHFHNYKKIIRFDICGIDAKRYIHRHLVQQISLHFNYRQRIHSRSVVYTAVAKQNALKKMEAFFNQLYNANPEDLENRVAEANPKKAFNLVLYIKSVISQCLYPALLEGTLYSEGVFAEELSNLNEYLTSLLSDYESDVVVSEYLEKQNRILSRIKRFYTVVDVPPDVFALSRADHVPDNTAAISAHAAERRSASGNGKQYEREKHEGQEDHEEIAGASAQSASVMPNISKDDQNMVKQNYWYTAEQINKLLNENLKDGKDACIYGPWFPICEGLGHEPAELFQINFRAALTKEIPSIFPVSLLENAEFDNYGLPSNQSLHGNHWIGLCLVPPCFSNDKKTISLYIIDSLGNGFQENKILQDRELALDYLQNMKVNDPLHERQWQRISRLMGLIEGVLRSDSTYKTCKFILTVTGVKQQDNSSDCGPFMVQNFVDFVNNCDGKVKPYKPQDALRIRIEHQQKLIESTERLLRKIKEERIQLQAAVSGSPSVRSPAAAAASIQLPGSAAVASAVSAPPQVRTTLTLPPPAPTAPAAAAAASSEPAPTTHAAQPVAPPSPAMVTATDVLPSAPHDAGDAAGVGGVATQAAGNVDQSVAPAPPPAESAPAQDAQPNLPNFKTTNFQLIANVLILVNYYCDTVLGRELVNDLNGDTHLISYNKKRGQKKRALKLADSLVKIYLNNPNVAPDMLVGIIQKSITNICGNGRVLSGLTHSPNSRFANSLKVLLQPGLNTIKRENLLPLLNNPYIFCLGEEFSETRAEDYIHKHIIDRTRHKLSKFESQSVIGKYFRNTSQTQEETSSRIQEKLDQLRAMTLDERKMKIRELVPGAVKDEQANQEAHSSNQSTIKDLILNAIESCTVRVGMVAKEFLHQDFGRRLGKVGVFFKRVTDEGKRPKTMKAMLIPSQFCRNVKVNARGEIKNNKLAFIANLLIISDYYCNTFLGQQTADAMKIEYNTENQKWIKEARQLAFIANRYYLLKKSDTELLQDTDFDNQVIDRLLIEVKKIVDGIRKSTSGNNSRLANELAILHNHFSNMRSPQNPVLLDVIKDCRLPQLEAKDALVVATLSYDGIGSLRITNDDAEDYIHMHIIQESAKPLRRYRDVVNSRRWTTTAPHKIEALTTVEDNLDELFKMPVAARRDEIKKISEGGEEKDIRNLIRTQMDHKQINKVTSPILSRGKFRDAVNDVIDYLFRKLNPKPTALKFAQAATQQKAAPPADPEVLNMSPMH